MEILLWMQFSGFCFKLASSWSCGALGKVSWGCRAAPSALWERAGGDAGLGGSRAPAHSSAALLELEVLPQGCWPRSCRERHLGLPQGHPWLPAPWEVGPDAPLGRGKR